ncbi:hypothetical protein B9Z55_002411 [Caenorhabditis nigoni]|uniref:Calponin-homology (CH) domain-containing protein n=1 Tax=Caenorhabditis nigoni TaxID=1611254 RepID=A0A2G5VKD6_9PELO|nr:hypothetical protein B9Z55_002411 [Caenorhabditis nigoni]
MTHTGLLFILILVVMFVSFPIFSVGFTLYSSLTTTRTIMSEEIKKIEEVAEEKAPEVPTTEPPVETAAPVAEEAPKAEEGAAEATPAAEGEAAAAAPEEKKKSGGVARRFTFNKRWGKHRDAEAAAPKEPEAPKDPKEDVLGWIAQQIPQAVHKANFQVIDWVQKTAIPEEGDRKTIPGKDQATTRNQFLGFFKDGDVLVKLANALEPGAVEVATAEENADAAAQKEVQKKNIDSFGAWAQKTLGTETAPVTSDDLLEKGKAGYSAVFQTLWQLGVQAKEKFDKEGFNVETIVQLANTVVKSGLLNTILGFFRRNRQAAAAAEEPKDDAAAAAEGAGEAAKEEGTTGDVTDTADEPVAVKQETSAPAAVAAN